MIINRTPLTLAQTKVYAKNVDDKKPVFTYLKKFCKLSQEESEKLSADIRALNNPKLKEETIVKIADFVPHDAEDLNKIASDVSLTESESSAILAFTKGY